MRFRRPAPSFTAVITVPVLVAASLTAACSSSTPSDGFQPGKDAGTSDDGGGSIFGNGDGGGGGGNGGCKPNPANYDIPSNGCDDDGNGVVDRPKPCDTALHDAGGAEDFAR